MSLQCTAIRKKSVCKIRAMLSRKNSFEIAEISQKRTTIWQRLICRRRGCEVDDAMQAHFREKVESLEEHWTGEVEAQVRVALHRGRYSAEITLLSGGLIMRGEERASNVRQAFDAAN